MFALAVAVHALLVLTMLHARLRQASVLRSAPAEATLWLQRPAPTRAAAALPKPDPVRSPRTPQRVVAPTAPTRVDEPQAITLAPEAPASAASAVLEPLNLSLSRAQLRASMSQTVPTLAQSLAHDRAPTALESLSGDERAFVENRLAGGESEVHVHGGCFRLVPTARSQSDPFNHGGEHLTAACH